MTDDKVARLLNRFCAAATAHHDALEAMDEARANVHARMLNGLYDAICTAGQDGRTGLLMLVENDTPVVAGMAAVYAMDLAPEACLSVLRRLAAEPGLLGFRAAIVVERWEEGSWQHPGKRSDDEA